MEINLEQIATLNARAGRILKAADDEALSGFIEERMQLISKYENQIEWFRHVGIDSVELKEVCQKLNASDSDNIIVIVVHDEDSKVDTFLFVEESLENYIGTYTQID